MALHFLESLQECSGQHHEDAEDTYMLQPLPIPFECTLWGQKIERFGRLKGQEDPNAQILPHVHENVEGKRGGGLVVK